jgi:hypothetical protein
MLKKLIQPLQLFLLNQGKCVACGSNLSTQKTYKKGNKNLIKCRCGRIYVKQDKFRRALFDEV